MKQQHYFLQKAEMALASVYINASPYRDRMINSLCHAWSCTPSYFIRKYLL